jgi:uncharacterized membrane protein
VVVSVTDAAQPAPAAAPAARSTLLAAFLLVVGAVVFLWYAPGAYSVYKALHVTFAVVWVGGDVTLTTLGIVFERKRDDATLAALGKMGAWIGVKIYTPALFAVIAFGIAMIEKGNLGWHVFWIDFGLVGWAIAACVGVLFVGPELGRIDRAAQQFGPSSAEVQKRVARLFAVFRFDTALLVLIVVVMAAKPTF